MVALNIGGEGEVPGAVNINSLVFPLRRPEDIKRAGPLIQADFTRLPVRSGVVDLVIGSRLPMLPEAMAESMCSEAWRVLRSGGTARLHASTGGGTVLLPCLERAGFEGVILVGSHATGVKP